MDWYWLAIRIWLYVQLILLCTFPSLSGETCCLAGGGQVGCCPYPNAVCCSDQQHCCPQNTVCNLQAGTCDGSQKLIPIPFRKPKDTPKTQKKSIPLVAAEKVEVVYCPDGASYCQDGSTCCLLSTGQYGCCPYPSATCCADRIHCCPYGSTCDATSQHCLRSFYAVAPKRQRVPALLLPVE